MHKWVSPSSSPSPPLLSGAPAHWRQRKAGGSCGAYAGLVAVIIGSPPAPLDATKLALMLQAGGGRVEKRESHRGAAAGINLAIVDPAKGQNDK